MMNELKIPLTDGVEAHGEFLKEVTIKLPLRFKDVRPMFKAGAGNEDTAIEGFLVNVLNIPTSSVNDMSVKDVATIMGELAPFLEPFQKIAPG